MYIYIYVYKCIIIYLCIRFLYVKSSFPKGEMRRCKNRDCSANGKVIHGFVERSSSYICIYTYIFIYKWRALFQNMIYKLGNGSANSSYFTLAFFMFSRRALNVCIHTYVSIYVHNMHTSVYVIYIYIYGGVGFIHRSFYYCIFGQTLPPFLTTLGNPGLCICGNIIPEPLVWVAQ